MYVTDQVPPQYIALAQTNKHPDRLDKFNSPTLIYGDSKADVSEKSFPPNASQDSNHANMLDAESNASIANLPPLTHFNQESSGLNSEDAAPTAASSCNSQPTQRYEQKPPIEDKKNQYIRLQELKKVIESDKTTNTPLHIKKLIPRVLFIGAVLMLYIKYPALQKLFSQLLESGYLEYYFPRKQSPIDHWF